MEDEKQVVQEQLIEFLCEAFVVDRDGIPLNRSLVDEGIIDSFGLVEIATFVERTYSFTVEEADMTRGNFGSVLCIVEYVQRRVAQLAHD